LDQHRDGNAWLPRREWESFVSLAQRLPTAVSMERVVILASPNTLLKHIKSSTQNKEAMISVVLT
jgi:hypothetical protein